MFGLIPVTILEIIHWFAVVPEKYKVFRVIGAGVCLLTLWTGVLPARIVNVIIGMSFHGSAGVVALVGIIWKCAKAPRKPKKVD